MREALCALEGFSPRSIDLAAMLLDGYGVAEWAPKASAVLSAQMAFFFWLDDRFDSGLVSPEVATRVVLEIHGDRAPSTEDERSLEAHGFAAIEATLWARHPKQTPRARWRASAASVVEAMLAESAIDSHTTLSEYVLVGAVTSTIGHLFATLAWHEDLSFDDPATAALVRRLALHARLHNDKHSLARDEREHTLANAILVAAHGASREAGATAIDRELARLEEAIAASADDERVHPRVRAMAPRMLATHKAFYQRAKDRYAQSAGT
ncbi:MAG: terpene synthase family protein [Polyangiales bacterium]